MGHSRAWWGMGNYSEAAGGAVKTAQEFSKTREACRQSLETHQHYLSNPAPESAAVVSRREVRGKRFHQLGLGDVAGGALTLTPPPQ